MYGFMWLAAIVVFLLLEAASYQFICIWFAGGALGALVAFGLGASLNLQILIFFILSALLLILTRPFVKKVVGSGRAKTNVESIPGKKAVVTEKINNLEDKGKAKLDGMVWTARSSDDTVIEEGTTVSVVEVSGVKLIVKKEI